MENQIPFTKMQGAGNDFIIIDNREKFFTGQEIEIFRNLCQRHFGIGADGLMLVDYHDPHEFFLKYYNSDGIPAEMCGNGARCAVYYVHLNHPLIKEFSFTVFNQLYKGEVIQPEWIKIFWSKDVEIKELGHSMEIISREFSNALFVNSGVPHLVLESIKVLEEVDVSHWGKFYRNHQKFLPAGTNVNFIRINKDSIQIRTYERGVEGETLACGTGALASAISADYWDKVKLPIKIFTRGGTLQVGRDQESKHVWLAGPARVVFKGNFLKENF
jgi:diaminopimelate epimerase